MTDNSGILEELKAERQELQHLIKLAQNITKEEVLSSAPFLSLEEKDGKLIISGIALSEGVWKNVLYPSDEIEKSAKRLTGKPLLVEHGQDADFKDKYVGKVTKAYYDKTLKSIVFQAEVTDPEAIKLVKEGTFPAVSCSTWLDKFPLNPDQSIGFNFQFNELSLVKNPACERCYIFAVEELSKKINQEKQDLNKPSQEINAEMKTMTEEFEVKEQEVIEELEEEEEIDLSEVEKPTLYAAVEVESLNDLPEELRKKVVSYYYGYYYPYYGYTGKYPYPGYPYYPYYPYYGYPGKKARKRKAKKPEKKSLWALLELESPEEAEELRKKVKKVTAVYYGYYGYPHYGYPYYGYKYPHYPYYPYYPYYPAPVKKKVKKSEEDEEEEEEASKKALSDEEELLDSLELAGDYKAFMKQCMKEHKDIEEVVERMKFCAAEWRKQAEKKAAEEYKCPEGQIWDEKQQKCVPIEEKEKYPAPEEKTSREWTDIEPGRISIPGPAEQAKEMAEKVKLSAGTVKKEETVEVPTVEVPMTEEKPVQEAPQGEEKKPSESPEAAKTEAKEEKVESKVEETPAEQPQAETPKVEEKPTETKVEVPKVEEKQEVKPEEEKVEAKEETKTEEVPQVEAPKEETPKEEEKEPTEEEIKQYVKEHWAELLLQLRKEKRFP